MKSAGLCLLLASCFDGKGTPIVGQDLVRDAGDGDSDSDTDSDSDSESDTDSGTGTDTGTESETDSGSDSECPAEMDECAGGWGGGWGDVCTDLDVDPLHCGSCDGRCMDDQYCASAECVCRPGYETCGGKGGGFAWCTNTSNDPANCGSCGFECGAGTPLCWNGECVVDCPAWSVRCESEWIGDYCADLDTSPRNCGFCGSVCHTQETCVQGDCEFWFPGIGCAACPCEACPAGFECCRYPGDDDFVICVEGDSCPVAF